MSQNRHVRFGRTFLVEVAPGEDILAAVEAAVAENNVTDAVFLSGIGDLDCCNSHFAAKDENGKYKDFPLRWENVPMTLSGVQGFIEKGRCHLHGVIGNDQECWTVHFHEGCTCLTSFRLVFAELLED
jgi:predicted DNA-binding protein with PD1-like motif